MAIEVPDDLTLGDGTIDTVASYLNDMLEEAWVPAEIVIRPLSELMSC